MSSSRWIPFAAAAVLAVTFLTLSKDASARPPDARPSGAPSTAPLAEHSPDTLVVRFKDGVAPGQAKKALDDLGATVKKAHGRSKLQVLQFAPGTDLAHALASLEATGLVAVAGFDYVARAFDAPNDPDYPNQWHLHDTTGGVWAESAWELATAAGAGVVVAVIDTGAAFESYTAPPVLWAPRVFAPAPDLAGVPIVAPWNFLTDSPHANDDHGHGTHVSGTILQATGNGQGMAGVAHGAALMPLKILDYSGSGSSADLVESIYYAVDNGADVINMSLGFAGTGEPDAYGNVCTEIAGLTGALDYANAAGVTVVAAAGNEGASQVACPAAYHPVISVGATRFDGTTTFYSNHGFALDVTAPGGDPNVDQDGNGNPDGVLQQTFCVDAGFLLLSGDYTQFCSVYMPGTSMASPHVAGIAALLLGENASLTPLQVRYYLQSTARDRGAEGWDDAYGWGAVDAFAALTALDAGPPPDVIDTPDQVPPATGPTAPTALTTAALTSNSIALSWQDNAAGETGYRVERATETGDWAQVAEIGANATGWTNTGLAAGTGYRFRVRAYDGTGNSRYSNVASAVTLPPPAAPSGLTATATSPTTIALNWADNSTSEAGFRIERSTNGTTFAYVTQVGANVTSYTNSYLTANTTYSYRVRAFEGTNNSAWSNVASATTLPPPVAPSGLTATATSPSAVTLSWSDNSTTETAFRIERSTNGSTFSYVGQVGANVTSYTNKYLAPNTTYWYRVQAMEGSAASTYSNVASATTFPAPGAPTGLTATATGATTIALAWTDNSSTETAFRIERSTNGTTFSYVGQVGANVTTYTNLYLSAGTTYWYRVQAMEGTVGSGYSNVASAATFPPPAAPTGLTATGISNSAIRLDWTDNATAETGFKIERSLDGSAWTQVATAAANTTTWTNNYLSVGTTYFYRVRAYEGTLNGPYSATAVGSTFPPPPAPSNLTAALSGATSVVLTWTDNAGSETGYRVERSTNGTTWSTVATLGANVTTWTNSSLTVGVTYYYRVRCFEGSVYSAYSEVVAITR